MSSAKNATSVPLLLATGLITSLVLYSSARAEDLLLDGQALELSGVLEYQNVELKNGSVITVTPYDGTTGTGELRIYAENIQIDATSSIMAKGAGYRGLLDQPGEAPEESNGGGEGGFGILDSGGGGAYGGAGGAGATDNCAGVSANGGDPYGSAEAWDVYMGSAGGAAGRGKTQPDGTPDDEGCVRGGNGGGIIALYAKKLTMKGILNVDGEDGSKGCNDTSGGGAGGGILVSSVEINITGSLLASGGYGAAADDIAGGGGGGRIKVFYEKGPFAPLELEVDGGTGGSVFSCDYAKDGGPGSVYYNPDDTDGDGFTYPQDCNPHDPKIYPGAPEVQNGGLDNDCDEEVDEGILTDDDLDTYSEADGDCDDTNPAVYPHAEEINDGIDNDCDGSVDEDPRDDDLDVDGYSPNQGDCNDQNPDIHPEALEVEDGVDNDCDNLIDEGTDAYDDDGDGYTEHDGDCDDGDPDVHPDQEEVADNGIDDDCDGEVDETVAGPTPDDTESPGGGGGCNCDSKPSSGPSGGTALVALLALLALCLRAGIRSD